VDRFIQLEIGKLPKSQEKQAKDAIYRLGPEAIFALVDGFNRAAQLESSCGTVTIGRKIEGIVRASDDPGLIAYVRENVGAGLDNNARRPLPLINAIRNVQTTCLLRKGELARMGVTTAQRPASPVAVGAMSMSELAKAAARQRGEPLKKVLIEVERRQGAQVPAILGKVAAGKDPAARKLAKVLLVQHAEKQSPTQLKVLLKHDNAEVRAAAARAIGTKGLRYGDELIALLQDDQPAVRQAAHTALVVLADGADFGPTPGASFGDRATAVQQWRQWWRKQDPGR
jgi:HEAT repeats